MKYTKEEHLDIGRRIYDGEISRYQAAEIYDISEQTARDYMRLYRDAEQLPPKRAAKNTITAPSFQTNPAGMEELESMTKEQLIQEYHLRFPSRGYRWLNAKIRLDTGLVLSDPYAHKCCFLIFHFPVSIFR